MSRIDQALRRVAREGQDDTTSERFALSDYVSEERRAEAVASPVRNDAEENLSRAAAPVVRLEPEKSTQPSRVWDPDRMFDPGAEITREIGRLATLIRERHDASPGFKSIAVTSVTESGAKTRAAVALALMLAREHGRTLLIDAEVSPPFAHEIMGVPASPGLADLPTGSAALLSIVELPPLHLLPAGNRVPGDARPIAAATMRAAVQACASQYDWVILNAPALSGFGEDGSGQSLRGACDRVVVVVSASNPFLRIHQALATLGREAVLGTVLLKHEP